ncbi:MAG TPA: hypothetical protein VN898_11210, partial [Candidatus Binatia bacterium]|nr:hypothetical protein [Candidatus Binatia bacterium]
TAKGRAVLEQIHSLAFDTVASEMEAALVEAAQIAEHSPRLNRQFDVHERPAPYGPRLNLVIVLRDAVPPGSPGGGCTLHVLRGGRYMARLGSAAGSREILERTFFLGDPRSSASSGGTSGGTPPDRAMGVDFDWQLIGSFLRRHQDEVNVLDIDECASAAEAEARLLVLVQAALAGPGRTVAR